MVPLHIRDETTTRLVRTLAKRKGIGLTEAIKLAVQSELRRVEEAVPLRERIAAIRRTVLAKPLTGKRADKDFFDELGGDL